MIPLLIITVLPDRHWMDRLRHTAFEVLAKSGHTEGIWEGHARTLSDPGI